MRYHFPVLSSADDYLKVPVQDLPEALQDFPHHFHFLQEPDAVDGRPVVVERKPEKQERT
ncbi:MAG: hypothetical protein IPP46_09385 [Bacteroidetes bacterium]|nr:hypothetical protein [Bacteroidota bacterium]